MLGDDMRRLGEEIAGAYEGRQQFLSDLKAETAGLKKQTADFLKDIHNEQDELSRKLKSELSDFTEGLTRYREDLEHEAGERRENLRVDLKERAQTLRSNLEQFKKDLNRTSKDRMAENRAAFKETADRLRAELDEFTAGLAAFKSGLRDTEAKRKHEARDEADKRLSGKGDRTAEVDRLRQDGRELLARCNRSHKEMTEALNNSLGEVTAGLSENVSEFLGELKQSRSEAARAWRDLLGSLKSGQDIQKAAAPGGTTEPVKKPAEAPAAPGTVFVEEEEKEAGEVETEAEEADLEEEEEMEEGLETEVLDALEENPQGLRMVEIAEVLGIDNWRTLIPVIRELVEDGEIRKEDSTYYIT